MIDREGNIVDDEWWRTVLPIIKREQLSIDQDFLGESAQGQQDGGLILQ